jgi:hypothetical protein
MFFQVAEENDLDFHFTICLSDNRLMDDVPYEEGVAITAGRINKLLQMTDHSDKWLRTPDGRLLFYTFDPESFAFGVKPAVPFFKDPDQLAEKMKRVAHAYTLLSAQVTTPASVLYTPKSFYYVTRSYQGDKMQYYRTYINSILDYFHGITTPFIDTSLFDPSIQAGNDYIIDTAKARKRGYVQRANHSFNMSKIRYKGQLVLASQASELKDVSDMSELSRYYIGSGLSQSFRRALEQGITRGADQLSIVTWNDLTEGHYLLPEANTNFGFGTLLQYYSQVWKHKGAPQRDQAIVFYKKHRSDHTPENYVFDQIDQTKAKENEE